MMGTLIEGVSYADAGQDWMRPVEELLPDWPAAVLDRGSRIPAQATAGVEAAPAPVAAISASTSR